MTDQSPAWIGRTISHYEILEKLGGGGMGIVYKARDLRLGRLAALKFLPAHLDSLDDRRRFLNEARAASSLDHPNICTVYEIGETGVGEGEIFIAMACYEGETLKRKIQRGILKIEEAIDYTVQIAAGLARAHAQGIIHRDIKPANLMITKDGQVKILDFGVAKLASDAQLTQSGVAVGTAAYMSPEQILGEPVDHRTDIWSLGVVLYEMLAGRLPFAREDQQAFAYAILHMEPRPIGRLRPEAPPELERILGKMLQKVPADRYQHVDEIPVDLRALRHSGSYPMLTTGPTAVLHPSALARRVPGFAQKQRKRLGTAAALVTAIVLTGLLGFAAARQMGSSRAERFPTFKALTYERGTLNRARFAPDGQTIVFGASWNGDPFRVFQTRPGSPVSSPIELPPADLLAVSRTGELAISLDHEFSTSDLLGTGTLARAPLLGGGARRLQESIADADWAPDGSGLAIVREGMSGRLEYPIGKVLHQVGGHISRVRFSPDGTRIAFLEHPNATQSGSVAVVDLTTGETRRLSKEWQSLGGLAWSASGDEVWFTGNRGWNTVLAAAGLDGRERTLFSFPADTALLDVAPDGRALLVRHEGTEETKVLLPGEEQARDVSWIDGAIPVDISDDGKTLLFSHRGEGSGPFYSVYLRDLERTSFLLGEGSAQAISPDGRWAASVVYGARSRILLLPTGAGRPRSREVGLRVLSVGFFPDGRRLALVGREAGRQNRCYVLDMANGALRPVTPEGILCPVAKTPVSPDGKLMVGWDDRSAALYPVDGGPPRKIPYHPGEWFLRWDSTGQALFSCQQTGASWPIYRLEIATGRRELWKEIEPADRTGIQQVSRIHVTPDGRTCAYHVKRTLSRLYLVEGLE